MGVETICCPDENNQVDLKKLMKYLGEEGIDSILLEANKGSIRATSNSMWMVPESFWISAERDVITSSL